MECSELIETFSGGSHDGNRSDSYDGGRRSRSGSHDRRDDRRGDRRDDRHYGHRDEHDKDWYWWRNYYGYGGYPWGLFNYSYPDYAINYYPDVQVDYYPLDSRYGSNGGSPMMADSVQASQFAGPMGGTGPMGPMGQMGAMNAMNAMNGPMAGRMANPMQKIRKEAFGDSMSMGWAGLISLIIIIVLIMVLIFKST